MLTDLDTFVDHYITTALWSSTDNADDSGGLPLDDAKYEGKLTRKARAQMGEDCLAWLTENAALCAELEAVEDYGTHPDCGTVAPKAAACAHDLWLTRNGHGAGFWDRDLPGDLGDRLSQAASKAGGRSLYVSRGWVYHCNG